MSDFNTASLDNLESRLTSHIEITNDKLDELINLSRQMAAIQERQLRHSDDIARLERSVLHDKEMFAKQIEKFETKLSVAEDERRAVHEKIFNKIDEAKANKDASSIKLYEDVQRDLDKIATKLEGLLDDYKTRMNFTRGVLAFMGIAVAVAQSLVIYFVSDFKHTMTDTAIKVQNLEAASVDDRTEFKLLKQRLEQKETK